MVPKAVELGGRLTATYLVLRRPGPGGPQRGGGLEGVGGGGGGVGLAGEGPRGERLDERVEAGGAGGLGGAAAAPVVEGGGRRRLDVGSVVVVDEA